MSKPLIELIQCDEGDWSVLRLDIETTWEGHDIINHDWVELLDKLGFKVQQKWISDEDMENGNY